MQERLPCVVKVQYQYDGGKTIAVFCLSENHEHELVVFTKEEVAAILKMGLGQAQSEDLPVELQHRMLDLKKRFGGSFLSELRDPDTPAPSRQDADRNLERGTIPAPSSGSPSSPSPERITEPLFGTGKGRSRSSPGGKGSTRPPAGDTPPTSSESRTPGSQSLAGLVGSAKTPTGGAGSGSSARSLADLLGTKTDDPPEEET